MEEKRKSCNQVLDTKAMSVIQKNTEGKAFGIAIQRWAERNSIAKAEQSQTTEQLCKEVNYMYNTNVNKKTVRKYFSTNRMGEVPRYGGGSNFQVLTTSYLLWIRPLLLTFIYQMLE